MAILSRVSDVLFLYVYQNFNLLLSSAAFREYEKMEVGPLFHYGFCDSHEFVFRRHISVRMQTA